MGRKRDRRRRSRLQAVRRIEAILDAVRGRGREDFDRRDPERGPRPRRLDLRRDGRLFDRLAALDFEYLMSLDFSAGPDTLRLLLPQSVLGRAQNGHGFWRNERGEPLVFRDATFDRVLTALEQVDPGLTAPAVRQERNRRLDRLRDFLLAHMFDAELPLEDAGRPLLGVELLRGHRVDTRTFLHGLVLAGWMDDWDQRRMCLSFHRTGFDGQPLRIGGGRTYVVRPDLLAAVGIVDPGRGEFTPVDIARLQDLGVIAHDPDPDRTYGRPGWEQAYFRLDRHEGVCDDLALIHCGARYGWDAMLGAFVMDAVDTYDKFLWTFHAGGFDGRLAGAVQRRWQERFGEPLVTGEEILDVIRFAAKLNAPECLLSSSHRRFIQTEHGSRVPTLLNHRRLIDGEPLYDIELGYNRFPAQKFYPIAWRRLRSAGLAVPEPTFLAGPGARRGPGPASGRRRSR